MTLFSLRDRSNAATDRSDSWVVRPVVSSRIAVSGIPRPITYFRLTAASLVVSPTPTPPVSTTRGAMRRRHRPTAWSSRARKTGDGRPQYCAAPSTTIASLGLARSRLPQAMTVPRAISQAATRATVAYQITRNNARELVQEACQLSALAVSGNPITVGFRANRVRAPHMSAHREESTEKLTSSASRRHLPGGKSEGNSIDVGVAIPG